MWLAVPKSKVQVHACSPVRGAPWWVILQHSIMLRLFFIVECGTTHFLCAIRVFKVWALSSSSRLPLCQISFRLWPPMEKNCVLNDSITHSLSLFDAPGTEVLVLRNNLVFLGEKHRYLLNCASRVSQNGSRVRLSDADQTFAVDFNDLITHLYSDTTRHTQ